MKKLLPSSLVLFMFYANPTIAVEPVVGEMGSNAATYMAAGDAQIKTEPTPDKPKHVHKRQSHKHGKQVKKNLPVQSHEHQKAEPTPNKLKHRQHKGHSH